MLDALQNLLDLQQKAPVVLGTAIIEDLLKDWILCFDQHVIPDQEVLVRLDDPKLDSPAEQFARQRRRNWARLLKKIYEVDPLTCPQSGSQMHLIAFIEESAVIRRILQHLELWDRP